MHESQFIEVMEGIDNTFNYELFFDLSPDLVCIAGYNGYFKRVNPAVSNVLGYSTEELYSRPINDFVYEEDKELTTQSRNKVKESNSLFHFENRYVTKDGQIVWLAWTARAVVDQQLVFGIAKDITHKKKLEFETLVLLKNLEIVNDNLKQFNLTAAHDLRSPLSNLMVLFDLLDTSKIADSETLELIGLLKQTGDNLRGTLNHYVDVLSEKVSDQKYTETVNVENSLNRVLASIQSLIVTSETTIQTDFSETDTVQFNSEYLESVFLNLITNSIKYSRQGHPPAISISTRKHSEYTMLVVSDNGMGFDTDKVGDDIFGLRQTFHNHADSKGVGLYLVKKHITSLGGKITLKSKPNEGTRFEMIFPVNEILQ